MLGSSETSCVTSCKTSKQGITSMDDSEPSDLRPPSFILSPHKPSLIGDFVSAKEVVEFIEMLSFLSCPTSGILRLLDVSILTPLSKRFGSLNRLLQACKIYMKSLHLRQSTTNVNFPLVYKTSRTSIIIQGIFISKNCEHACTKMNYNVQKEPFLQKSGSRGEIQGLQPPLVECYPQSLFFGQKGTSTRSLEQRYVRLVFMSHIACV